MKEGKAVMFEGAQATLLDIDHGTYPFVTSSNASVGGICTGLGVPPRAIGGVLGVAKAYTTRVGEGPLPTELSGALAERLRESGQEYGASTGRPRRCGWYDAVVVRYSARINGLDALALTKLDVLDGLPEVQICTGYETGGGTITEFPADLRVLAGAEPVYERCPAGRRRPRARRGSSSSRRRRSATSAAGGGQRRRVRDHLDRIRPRRDDRAQGLRGRSVVPVGRTPSSVTHAKSVSGHERVVTCLVAAVATLEVAVGSLLLVRLDELVDRRRVGVEELDAGAVAGPALRHLE